MRKFFMILLCALLLIPCAKAEEGEKYVALTFDDGPSGRFTRRLLEGLDDRDAKATFFLCGYRVKDYGKEARRIAEEGHEIGIHGYSHDSMCPMSAEEVTKEIRSTAELLPEGCHPLFLRPPGGACGDGVTTAAANEGLAVLNWSLDSKDWATRDVQTIINNVVKKVRDGDVILMHDMSDSSVTAALRIIDMLSARGYEFVTVSELAQIKGAKLTPGRVYERFD